MNHEEAVGCGTCLGILFGIAVRLAFFALIVYVCLRYLGWV